MTSKLRDWALLPKKKNAEEVPKTLSKKIILKKLQGEKLLNRISKEVPEDFFNSRYISKKFPKALLKHFPQKLLNKIQKKLFNLYSRNGKLLSNKFLKNVPYSLLKNLPNYFPKQ